MTEKDLKQRFCKKPFEFFEVAANGNAFCCCPGWLPKPIGNLQTHGFMEVWNSETAQEIRESILDGSFKYCRAQECPLIGSDSLPYKKDVSEPHLQEAIANKATVLKHKPKILNLAYDRTCNLSCPSCRTQAIVLKGKEYDAKQKLQELLLADGLDDARKMIVTGSGDPFASRLYQSLLKQLDSSQYPQLKIHLMTNGLLFTKEAWENWHKINKSIKTVQISIDAASEATYSIVRRGGDFQRLLVNLEFISFLRSKKILDFVSLEFVVQQKNYQEMANFVKLGKDFDVDRVAFSRIRNWNTFSSSEFELQTVHSPKHPEHSQFREIFQDPIFKDPIVFLGNLQEFLPS